MFTTFRPALVVVAALSAASVAPAQVQPLSEPLIVQGSNAVPAVVIPASLPEMPAAQPAIFTTPELPVADPLAPAPADPVVEPRPTGDLKSKVAQLRSADPGSRELECLAVGIYFESKSEPLAGQLAVGQVIANRAASGRFPSSYCGVLFQRSQFSFVRGHSWPAVAKSGLQWKNAVAIAKIVDGSMHESAVPKALFFHATRVSPRWRLTRVGTIGNHVFYR